MSTENTPPQNPNPQHAPPPQIIIQQAPPKKPYFLYGCGGCLGTIVLVTFLGAIGSRNVTTAPPSSPPSSQSAPAGSSQSAPAKEEAISISAKQLDAEYEKNAVAADNKYKDKTVLVTGTIQDIGKDIASDSYVSLAASNQFMPVRCVFEESEKDKLAQLSKGQTVTIRGICHGKMMGITIAYATLE